MSPAQHAHATRVIAGLLTTPAPSDAHLRAVLARHRQEHGKSLRTRAEYAQARGGFATAMLLFAQADEIDPRGGAR